MASTSASVSQKSFKYDVFLSFRGEDTRKNFVDHLYHALHQKGIITYKDDEKIQKGERISEQLIRSIKDSRFHIIVFSKNYASSSWCLDELVKIIECQTTKEQTAYPIFFDVEPTEVRHQSGAFGKAFAEHETTKKALNFIKQENEDDVGRWRNALKEAAGLAGMELKTTFNGHEAKFIQQIVQEISPKLHIINSSIDEKLVGMETRVKRVISSLQTGSDDVRMIGIKGMGGGGKTTLARAVFDLTSVWFEGVSFVENVREVSKGSSTGLKKLQKQVLKDVLADQNIDVTSVSDGKNKMKRMMPGRKALVVLDDVDDIEQLDALAGELTWFKPGSRIIITTRDKQVLLAHRVNFIHDVSLLSNEEAVCLFSRHAFGREIPVHGYEELSRKVVHYAAGLPLTIKVLGSHLCGRSDHVWKDAIERLKTIPEDQTFKRLEISYNGLEDDQKEIFLDVVCMMKYNKKEDAIRILDSCGYYAEIGLGVLEQKSLITISGYGKLGFHDRIEEMGWNIVRRSHPNEPSRHSRLWIKEEIEDILFKELGTKATRSMYLRSSNLHPVIIMKGIRKMEELRLLDVRCYAKEVDEVSKYLPDALQSLCWSCHPFRSLPEMFQANNLVYLEMHECNIIELWEGGERKVFNKLKFLNLSYSLKLRTFDLSMTPHLEELNLKGCGDFVELQSPVECPNLKVLNLSRSKVSHLNIGMVPHLEELNLEGCGDFVELKLPVECLNLKILNLSRSKVSHLNIGMVPHLEKLYLEDCSHLKEIHAPVGCLKKLVYFSLSYCLNVVYFSVYKQHESASLIDTVKIKVNTDFYGGFRFICIYDEHRSSWSGNLEKLFGFGSSVCENQEYFLATVCDLQHLRELTLEGSIPQDLWRLESLEKLTLSLQQFQHLPDSIFMLKNLKSLKLGYCRALEQLPENICRLECLEELIIRDCRSLRDIPNNICRLKCLKRLELSNCPNIKKLPEELGSLECLKELWIKDTDINRLPQSIYQLKGLRIYGSMWQLESYDFVVLDCCCDYDNIDPCTGIRRLPGSIYQLKGLRIYGSREELESYGFTSIPEFFWVEL
ncbi:TMV resistance protein N-like [Bidens hawaiensis]|uniref:TMV resistance protein N-like n=1 Tax=Bidens hawaiensis TaxID=980011 RepID=UPI0040495370